MSEDTRGRLFVVTGIQGAGKTTVGQALAEALPRSVFVDGDTVAGLVVGGRAGMTPRPSRDAFEQLLLRYSAALTLADTYRSAGFDAVVADNVFGELLDDFLDFAAPERVHLVVLHPSQEAVTEREVARGKDVYANGFTIAGLWEALEHDTRRVGLWIDTSRLSVEDTVGEILLRTDAAVVETSELDLGDR